MPNSMTECTGSTLSRCNQGLKLYSSKDSSKMGNHEKRKRYRPSDDQMAKAIVDGLLRKGFKLLALDFDKTIISVHTYGYWREGTHKLVEYVRPCFKALIKAALESSLHVCVVTYSMQPVLIRDVLKTALPKSDVERIFIRGNTKEWQAGQAMAASAQPLGKEQHLAWVCTELFNQRKVIIAANQILLIDDDQENCNVAVEFGHQAYEVSEEICLPQLWEFCDSLRIQTIAPRPS